MGFFEHFSVFIFFANLLGFFPYRIESYGKNKRITFSWCHPLTIWFGLSFLLQLLPVIATTVILNNAKQIVISTSELPLSLVIVSGVGIMAENVMLLVNRAVVLRYCQQGTAVHSISAQTILKELEEFATLPQCRNSINKRTSIGIFFILIIVTFMFSLKTIQI